MLLYLALIETEEEKRKQDYQEKQGLSGESLFLVYKKF